MHQVEPAKPGWTAPELSGRAKADAQKTHIARRLRTETTASLKWLEAE